MKECIYAKYCGGCSELNVDYNTQLINKAKHVQDCLKQYNIDYNIPKTIGMYFPYKYRNKVHLAFKSFKGKTIIGFYEEGSSRVVDIEECLLHADWLKKLINILRVYVKKYRITPYDPMTKSGIIRYAVARVIEDKIMLTIVATTKNFAGREFLYAKLSEAFKSVSLYININKRTDKLVMDENGFSLIKGDKYLTSNMLGVKYAISPNSFLQINTEICKVMYQKACDWLNLTKDDKILDLYSGIGITSIFFAKKCKSIDSIEYNTEATQMAKYNIKLNSVDNVCVYTGAVAKVLDKLDLTQYNKVFLDPARMGAEKETLDMLNSSNVERIVYMSCDPETLARDLSILTKKYRIEEVICYDMFPQTRHVETLVLLARKNVENEG